MSSWRSTRIFRIPFPQFLQDSVAALFTAADVAEYFLTLMCSTSEIYGLRYDSLTFIKIIKFRETYPFSCFGRLFRSGPDQPWHTNQPLGRCFQFAFGNFSK